MFGATPPPQNELTPFHPRSPYAVAKVYSYWATVNYREAYDLFATNGILFNHESPRRGTGFVTRKITREISRILAGKTNCIYLGNMDAKRDWGFAPEYVQCMHLMLQQNEPGDFVMGTGESYSVREFLVSALKYCCVEIEWKGTGVNELGVISSISSDCVESKNIRVGDTIIKIDPYYFRPTEVDYLMADISKSKEVLGWEPTIKCNDLIKIMMDSDLKSMNITPKNESLDILRNKNFDWVLDMNLSEVLN
jgi:GDPmannose 4,6-dehydratase